MYVHSLKRSYDRSPGQTEGKNFPAPIIFWSKKLFRRGKEAVSYLDVLTKL